MAKLNMEAAIELYYSTTELSNSDIRKIFGINSTTSVQKYKKSALAEMAKRNAQTWEAAHVDTECAFSAWGIDIKNLEARMSRLRKLFPEKYKSAEAT